MSALTPNKPTMNLPQASDAEPDAGTPTGAAVGASGSVERAARSVNTDRSVPGKPPARSLSAFVPTLLGLLALIGTLGSQSWQLVTDRASLQAAHAAQQQTVDSAAKLRASLDALASDTQRLADAGNASAALLVAELRKRGVTINAAATPAASPR